ncbi:uncharacterized protein KY384_007325 [Bacidia gigantensis]|uniref:uncharacterized protein n=1 Tax=Bacidia gigantensis TaxID=2732470 RepID=UPI001D0369C8|nr:uncharacterized protein KY384_007325 [Bacidia gigantensis]KAG8528407.1 hypothetical protein KY384_007325 [Bacidia gigantensis]
MSRMGLRVIILLNQPTPLDRTGRGLRWLFVANLASPKPVDMRLFVGFFVLLASLNDRAVTFAAPASRSIITEIKSRNVERILEILNITHPIPEILHCDNQQKETITFAWLDATLQIDQAYPAITSPIYDDTLGNTKPRTIIFEILHQVQDLIPIPGSPALSPAKIACINSHTMDDYPAFLPLLYTGCLSGGDTPIIGVTFYDTLFICDAFWHLPPFPEPHGETACPPMLLNHYPVNGQFPMAQSTALLHKAVQIYGGEYIDLKLRDFVNVDMAVFTRQEPTTLNVAVFLYRESVFAGVSVAADGCDSGDEFVL